jgi:hypothetical protein
VCQPVPVTRVPVSGCQPVPVPLVPVSGTSLFLSHRSLCLVCQPVPVTRVPVSGVPACFCHTRPCLWCAVSNRTLYYLPCLPCTSPCLGLLSLSLSRMGQKALLLNILWMSQSPPIVYCLWLYMVVCKIQPAQRTKNHQCSQPVLTLILIKDIIGLVTVVLRVYLVY